MDQEEITRNEEIYKAQGNRNPFIDYPELAAMIADF
ncbi:MAG: endonuclease [Bdellovibrionales bacterium]|nr:endonuclease [Bdellovibrionales bacterium]